MKSHLLPFAFALALLAGSPAPAGARPTTSPAPIVIQLAEIDRCRIDLWAAEKAFGDKLGLPLKNWNESAVDVLVRAGIQANRPVWIMDGRKVIGKCHLLGEYCDQYPDEANSYGLFVGFDTVKETQNAGAAIKLERSLEELIRLQKVQMKDPRYWSTDMPPPIQVPSKINCHPPTQP